MLTALASASTLDHPLLNERENPKRAGILLITADRGLCGGYNSAAIKAAEELGALLRPQGKELVLYVIGRKGVGYYTFRQRPIAAVLDRLLRAADLRRRGAGDRGAAAGVRSPARPATTADGDPGIDEIHLVSTHFVSMITQRPQARRMAPMEIEYVEHDDPGRTELLPAYEFEPSSDAAAGRDAAEVPEDPDLRGAARSPRPASRRPAGPPARPRRTTPTTSSATSAGRPTRPGRRRSPRNSARSSAAPMLSPQPETKRTDTHDHHRRRAHRTRTATGRVVRVIGPVVDVEFPRGGVPAAVQRAARARSPAPATSAR